MLEQPGQPLPRPPGPEPGPGQLLLHVKACGVCRTDLHLRDREIEATKLPVVLGHQIVATTEDGRRVGVPWLGWTDGTCRYCTTGRENLCVSARFTGRDIDGGFAELTVADERFCLPLPDSALTDEQAAPLLCGGLIGYRALKLAGDADEPRSLRLRLRRAHDLPGRRLAGPVRVRIHAQRRRAHPAIRERASARHGPAPATTSRPSSSTPRSSSPRPASWCRRHSRHSRPAAPSSARASTCPTSRASPTTTSGRSA